MKLPCAVLRSAHLQRAQAATACLRGQRHDRTLDEFMPHVKQVLTRKCPQGTLRICFIPSPMLCCRLSVVISGRTGQHSHAMG